MTDDTIKIYAIPKELLPLAWQHLGPSLAKGSADEPPEVIDAAVERIMRDHAQVWGIFDEFEVLAAFITSIVFVEGDSGPTALNIYGMGGNGVQKFRHKLCDTMLEYAKANECSSIIFEGREALRRVYEPLGNLRQVKGDDGNCYYERPM